MAVAEDELPSMLDNACQLAWLSVRRGHTLLIMAEGPLNPEDCLRSLAAEALRLAPHRPLYPESLRLMAVANAFVMLGVSTNQLFVRVVANGPPSLVWRPFVCARPVGDGLPNLDRAFGNLGVCLCWNVSQHLAARAVFDQLQVHSWGSSSGRSRRSASYSHAANTPGGTCAPSWTKNWISASAVGSTANW